jgi:hypothetical protein
VVSWSGDSAHGPSGPPSTESSEAPSTGDPGKGPALNRAALRTVVGEVLTQATNLLSTMAGSEIEQQHGLWRADEDDVAGISSPASRLIWRRVPKDARDSDTLDLIGLGVAVAGYVVKNWRFKAMLAKAYAGIEQGDQGAADTPAA